MTEESGKCFTDQVVNITGITLFFFKEKGMHILIVRLFAENTQGTRLDPQHPLVSVIPGFWSSWPSLAT